jgi:hypothetical protein
MDLLHEERNLKTAGNHGLHKYLKAFGVRNYSANPINLQINESMPLLSLVRDYCATL